MAFMASVYNTGPYGPNEASVNMGAPVNMTQVNSGMIPHNLSNMSRIPQQPPQSSTGGYNLHNFSPYTHQSLNMNPQISPFQHYQPSSFQHNFIGQISNPMLDTGWQNSMLAMNLNTRSEHPPMDNYPSFDKHTNVSHIDNQISDQQYRKTPLNIPQVQTKAYHKHSGLSNEPFNDYGVFNDSFQQNTENNLDLSKKTSDILEHDSNRRKTLENTIKLIENILVNTTKNRDMGVTQETHRESSKSDNNHSLIGTESDDSKDIDENSRDIDENSRDVDENSRDVDENNRDVDENSKDIDESSKDIDESSKDIDENSKDIDDINDNTKENDSSKRINKPQNIQEVNIQENRFETEHKTSTDSEEDVKPDISKINNMEQKIDVETGITIKVEPVSVWTDTESLLPFHNDKFGVPREEIMDSCIIECDRSVTEAVDIIKNGTSIDAYFECPHCYLMFKHPKRFLIHAKWHTFGLTNERRIELAKEKEAKRNQKKEAKLVERLKAKEIKDMSTSTKTFSCKDCNKAFTSKSSLKNHRQRYHPTRPRDCKICHKTVVGWLALRKHTATHTSESGYQCADCPKRFKYPHSLAKHRDTHLEKTHACEQCPKMFGSQALLKMHMKCHERAQRGATFRCTYCGKGFFESWNLQVHERTHRNERPFTCEICKTSFGTNSSLKRHLKVSHSKSKPHVCSTCHRSFISETILSRHERRAHGDPEEFKFVCKDCPCRYLTSKDLQKHVYKSHPKGKSKKQSASDTE